MKDIDWLPGWYIAERVRRRDRWIRGGYLAAVVLAMIALASWNQAQSALAASKLQNMREARGYAGGAEVESAVLEQHWSGLQERRAVLGQATCGAPTHRLLAELTGLLPDALLLTSMHLEQDAAPQQDALWPAAGAVSASETPSPALVPGKLTLAGLAASDRQVGELISRMNGSPAFRNVRLRYSRAGEADGRPARSFEVACEIPAFE